MEAKPVNDFATALEAIRLKRGESRAEFAEAIAFDRPGYYCIINGRNTPGLKFIEGVLALEALTESERIRILEGYLQLQLDRINGGGEFRVKLSANNQ